MFKVSDNQLIIYDADKYEQAPAQFTLTDSDIESYTLKTQSHDLYTACKVEYYDEDKRANNYTYTSDNGGMVTGQTLIVKKRS